MEMFGKTLCVTFDELVGSGIMSQANYKKHVRDGKFRVLRRGGNGRKAQIAYESLPEAIRTAYDARNPRAKEQLIQPQLPMNERMKLWSSSKGTSRKSHWNGRWNTH
ncbi:hypothetical protein [uncultured Bacteroides sp.]|uniref:hypothetical protein n=1 Tax=uncultured Bacteroides sp. TaxID=162156 RepID=UPI0025E97663|nr:hypothetical protein [uncultured Bacteroides sp.]